ncbi:MAG: hypothetical protein IPP17_15920 [Bacteroidetes bacterium]|nr:hypothetical protein [Bacteroidota bacterium]
MRCLHETKKLVNYLLRERIIDQHDTVVVEMARELNESNKRAGILEWQKIQDTERQNIRKFLAEQMQIANPSEDLVLRTRLWLEQIQITEGDQQRAFLDKQLLGRELGGRKSDTIVTNFQLWKEQKGICIYSGKQISPTDILNGTAVQAEHTIPLSRSNDSTMQNLTLATATANKDKGQRTPFEVGHGVGVVNDYETIKQRLQP